MKIQLSVHLLTTERHLSRGFGLKEAILEAPFNHRTSRNWSGDAEESKHPVFGKCVDKASFDVMATW